VLALGRQLRTGYSVPLLLGAKSAEQRMALFLLGLSSRFIEHGLPGRSFRLPMSRQCIADYLGLAMETVSRIFKRFDSRALIAVHSRQLSLRDMGMLRVIAGLGG
jgi:CRP/FNR family transcriptional regulator